MKLSEITLESVGAGAAVELFAHEWAKVLANIQDPNTEATDVREVVVSVKVKPQESRDEGRTMVRVKSKLAAPKAVESSVYFGQRGEKLVAAMRDPRQMEVFPEDDVAADGVTPIRREADSGR